MGAFDELHGFIGIHQVIEAIVLLNLPIGEGIFVQIDKWAIPFAPPMRRGG
jgi:hypothetical protein